MVFSSIVFLTYLLPIFLLLYYLVGFATPGTQWKNILTLLVSIIFYAWGAPQFVLVVVGTATLDFYLVQAMHRSSEKRRRKIFLASSIALNLALLLYFKYANFFIGNVNAVLGQFGATEVEWTKVALPIGISFFTFQKISYTVDVHRGVHQPLKNVTDYLLYILMFPQMIAGPIVRFHTIAGEIRERYATMDDRLRGFYRFCIGLAKKVLIANVLGAQADEILSMEIAQIDSTLAWIGILAYTFQIYFDFSGYSDMAIGIGRMIGFTFPENFDNPYTSGSITEFWRRWHITLGAWMRDYLYIPLGGNRVKTTGRLYLNLWLVFLFSGLWHGASWNFVLWGAFHGIFLVLDRLFLLELLKKIWRPFRVLICFFLVVMGWVIFRIEDMPTAGVFYNKLFAFEFGTSYWVSHRELLLVFILAILFSFLTLTQPGKKLHDRIFAPRSYTDPVHLGMTLASLVLLLLCLASITATDFNPFIYYRF